MSDASDEELEKTVRAELEQWFAAGSEAGIAGTAGASAVAGDVPKDLEKTQPVSEWRHLKTYRIPFAQPNQVAPTNLSRDVALGDGGGRVNLFTMRLTHAPRAF